MFLDALTFQLGYNASLVGLGAALLGVAAGATGTFLFLRKRALVSDAISHATLPGVALAFIAMSLAGFDGRNLGILLAGSAVSAAAGLIAVQWLSSQTRLSEDAAIGAVLSVFFGFGIVLLTVIQNMATSGQAGLEGLLLGSTAGMLFSDAVLIAAGGAAALALVLVFRRPMTIASFDPGYARSAGIDVGRTDLIMMGLVMGVTVIGLKVVGLILIVALLIIPPVAARFWTERADRVALIAGGIGGVSGWVGAAISASTPNLPTGPIIVLTAFGLFCASLLFAPARGLVAAGFRHRRFQRGVHIRQGLLSLAQGHPIYEPLTIRLLTAERLARADGVATDDGRARAARALRDETRWQVARRTPEFELAAARYDGLTQIEDVLTPDQIAQIDAQIGPPKGVPA
ncbi:iron chelate uptake ABC transporter family permease subunit [Alphaproteobacteria bacterium GH1-50]|uniref:Iron chelate uptake ABC transporter family permease subunit n=1 Tax=Kangsaoukella pontilimi TaxID=2691042 RepID=A0A7C9IDZ5_9RHOB|nr:metal ABC transporter permease [Kangsaoukella pontilimi]MXQ06347.1 iron chelate uptake ABC transporter family permease subunit [Kangsaoukella pontilimi]